VVTDVDYTSSTSMPSVVAEMLHALRIEPGMSVLELGTGTGWNAALLAHRLGAQNVTLIEIDPDISAHARRALASAGYGAVTVITGDGALGYDVRAPYDRVLSTACVYRVPRIRIADVVTDKSERHAEQQVSTRRPRWYVVSYDAQTAIGMRVPRCKVRYTPPGKDDLTAMDASPIEVSEQLGRKLPSIHPAERTSHGGCSGVAAHRRVPTTRGPILRD
jgi:SAM-dependent methyltransferase